MGFQGNANQTVEAMSVPGRARQRRAHRHAVSGRHAAVSRFRGSTWTSVPIRRRSRNAQCGWSATSITTVLFAVGCGGATAPQIPPAATHEPVPLVLVESNGRRVAAAELRGKQTLLFVFATFDGMSQAALTPIRQFVEQHPDIQVVGILHEPNARTFLPAWEAASTPPFLATWERSGSLIRGSGGFQPVTTVPSYVLLDARGHEAGRHAGYLALEELDQFVERSAAPYH